MARSAALVLCVISTLLACGLAGDDAVPQSTVQGFAQQHSGTSAGKVQPAGGKEKGKELKLGGLNAYVSIPSKTPTAAVLLFTDVFGYKTEGIRSWADKLAAEGFLAVIPDFFKGNPRSKNSTPESFPAWRALFPREQVLNETAAVQADIRKTFPSVKKFGVQGFCWGGLHPVLLSAGSPPPVSAAVVYHGSLITKADLEAVNGPILFQQSDPKLDRQINETVYKEFQGILKQKAAKGIDASIANFPGQPHGFSLRGDSSEPATATAAAATLNNGLAFIKKHLTQ